MDDAPHLHLIPREKGHERSEGCPCKPFLYDRIWEDDPHQAIEVRHNAFTALPVDEKALEVAQGRRSALDDAEGHS